MVKIKKYLSILIIFNLLCSFIFAQELKNSNEKSQENISQFDESNIILEDSINLNNSAVDKDYKSPSTVGLLLKMIFVLIIVIVLIYVVLRFIKKKTNIVKTEDDFLRRAAYINIAPGKTVEVITLIDKAYLIGVTEDNITFLGEIEDKELINAMNVNADKNQNVKKPLNFDDVLDIFTAKGKKKSNVFTETEQQIDNMYKGNEGNENS